jgi:8-oxo-dGTP pyrophosphatase MutT (NUDIX family)
LIDPIELAALVGSFSDPLDLAASKSQELTLHLLLHSPTPLSRSQFTPGHITTTALVLHPERDAMLLIHHRRLDRWLLPGGHVEPEDETIQDSAAREALEETGVQLSWIATPPFIGMDVHGIPPGKGEPLHYHHDLIFLFRAASSVLIQGSEVRQARWFDTSSLSEEVPQLPGNILRSMERALNRSKHLT